jgi:hypothetical protein
MTGGVMDKKRRSLASADGVAHSSQASLMELRSWLKIKQAVVHFQKKIRI